MRHKYLPNWAVFVVTVFACFWGSFLTHVDYMRNPVQPEVQVVIVPVVIREDVKDTPVATVAEPEPMAEKLFTENETPEPSLTQEEIDLIALITMGEAEGESELGQRLVIDTILNRVDSICFPNTVHDVIYQPHAFSVVNGDRLTRCEVQEHFVQLVHEELANRTNSDVLFFNAKHYSKYGQPLFQEDHHYFSAL